MFATTFTIAVVTCAKYDRGAMFLHFSESTLFHPLYILWYQLFQSCVQTKHNQSAYR